MSQRPYLILGRGGIGPILLLANGAAYTDDSTAYNASGKTNKVAPAGAGGECIFTVLYLTTTHFDVNVSLWITPYVDGVALTKQRLNLVGVPGSDGETKVNEIGLSVAHSVSAVERLRYAPRGTWFQVLVETDAAIVGLGACIVSEVEVEYEVVRESKEAIAG